MPKPDITQPEEIRPDPKLEKRTRRTFTADYKLSISQQAAACKQGELGALLCREKLYSGTGRNPRCFYAENSRLLDAESPVQRDIFGVKENVTSLLDDNIAVCQ